MAEYITKKQVIEWFMCYAHEDRPIRFEDLEFDIQHTIPEDVAPVRHGWWDNIPNTYMCVAGKDGSYHGNATSCSECNEINPNAYKTNYCPNCGAKMDLEV